jgi:hypothetical protein
VRRHRGVRGIKEFKARWRATGWQNRGISSC